MKLLGLETPKEEENEKSDHEIVIKREEDFVLGKFRTFQFFIHFYTRGNILESKRTLENPKVLLKEKAKKRKRSLAEENEEKTEIISQKIQPEDFLSNNISSDVKPNLNVNESS